MGDINYRLSGGVTGAVSVEARRILGLQVINQGIGFNDRVVSNVPLEGTGEVFNEDTISSGSFMQFMSQGWIEGLAHARGSVVTNGIFTMVANVLTLGNPYPQPDGTPTRTIPSFAPTTESDTSVIYSGHTWTLTEAVLLKSLRIWVTQLTGDTHYRIVIIIAPPGADPVTSVIDDPVLVEGEFKIVAALNSLYVPGTTITIIIDALNSGSSNEVTGGWFYVGQDNTNAPIFQGWNQNNSRTVVRIDKTDLDGGDRTAELLGIITNSTLQFSDTSNPNAFDLYRTVGAPVDSGSSIIYPVVLNGQGEGGVPVGITTLTATVPIAQVTEYAQELAGLADTAWATVEPFLEFNGVPQSPLADTAFGVDLEAEITVFNEDWDVLSFNG